MLLKLAKQLAEAKAKGNPLTTPSTPSGMVPVYEKPTVSRDERHIFVSSQFLSTVYPGADLIDLLVSYDCHDLAAVNSDRRGDKQHALVALQARGKMIEEWSSHLARRITSDE